MVRGFWFKGCRNLVFDRQLKLSRHISKHFPNIVANGTILASVPILVIPAELLLIRNPFRLGRRQR